MCSICRVPYPIMDAVEGVCGTNEIALTPCFILASVVGWIALDPNATAHQTDLPAPGGCDNPWSIGREALSHRSPLPMTEPLGTLGTQPTRAMPARSRRGPAAADRWSGECRECRWEGQASRMRSPALEDGCRTEDVEGHHGRDRQGGVAEEPRPGHVPARPLGEGHEAWRLPDRVLSPDNSGAQLAPAQLPRRAT